jgi:ABC-type antimicrobial peptide transport system permease subunit
MASGNGRRSRGVPFFSIVTLASWQMRQTWRLLMVCAAGILAAVVLVCIMPLYSQIALSSSLHTTLNATPGNSTIIVSSTLSAIQQPNTIDTLTGQVAQTMQNDMAGEAVDPQPQFVVSMGGTPILLPGEQAQLLTQLSSNPEAQRELALKPQIQLVGLEQGQLASHIHLVQGRLPRPANNMTEIALLPSVAHCLFLYQPSPAQSTSASCFSVGLGDEITIISPFAYPVQDQSSPNSIFINGQRVPGRYTFSVATLRVVGMFTPINEADPFWQGNSFESESVPGQGVLITGLTSSEALASTVNHAVQSRAAYIPLRADISLFWYYQLDIAHIDSSHTGSLEAGINNFLTDVGNSANGQRGIQTTASGPTDILNEFSSRVALAQIPVALLLLLVVSMVILFISIVIELLVERQTEAIALLRSRGASRRQIFAVFTTQMIALVLFALIIGPLLAIPLTVLLAQRLFSPLDPNVVGLITTQPLQTVWNIRWYALLSAGLVLLSTMLTLYQTMSFDVLALRHETSRPRRIPLWQRFYLDGLLAILALGGYSYALYSINADTLDPATSSQVLSPLIIGGVALFLLAGLLLFLRFFPRLVRLVGNLAVRRGGVASMLALSQLARTPRQAVRTILLLTLTTAFALFSLVFSASQSQRIVDVVNYQVGADFSAQLPTNINTNPGQPAPPPLTAALLATETASYRAIPGVLSATLGIMMPAQLGNTSPIIKAVDADTFAQTATWTTEDSTQPLALLMAQLSSSRKLAQDAQVIPAIVDAETWNALHLNTGQRFTLTLAAIGANGTQLPFLALAEVQHIPTMISTEGGNLTGQGILVDAQSFASVFTKITNQPPSINYVWLHTRTNESSLESVRTALAQRVSDSGDLAIFDRQAFITTLQHDPLMLNLVGILVMGTLTPLILALLGSLLLAWMSVRSRLLSFAVLRALGSSPRQLAGVLSWEQAIIYILMLVLGVLSSILLSAMALPALILTSIAIPGGVGNAASTLSFQADLPALQVIIPPLVILVLGLLITICILTLGLMARVASRPSISQTLRLNAD